MSAGYFENEREDMTVNDGKWFSEARFGMMLHWGLYSLLGGEYKGRQCGGADDGGANELGEWIQSFFAIPCAEYEQYARAFNPIGFDAEEYVKMARDAGMNYLVVTSKHHEGFAMFKSDADPYNIVDATPFGRDPIAELAAACKKYGVKFGLYYSQELDWHKPDGGGYTLGYKNAGSSWTNNWDFPDNAHKDFSRCFEKKIKPQVKEILTRYGEISVIWFDTPSVISPAQSRELYDLVKKYQPNCLVNSRIGNGMGDYASMGDNQVPGAKKNRDMLYETAATLNDTWGYKSYDQNWKTPEQVISLLTRLASRNVNYLLNVGPDHLGRIPVGAQKVLREVGEWMKVNAEAVYATEPSPYSVDLMSGPVTEKGDSLYFFVNKPEHELLIPGVLTQVESAEVLGAGKANFTQEGALVRVELPDLTGKIIPVVKLTAKGGVKVDEGLIELPGFGFLLTGSTAKIEGGITLGNACDAMNWKSPEDGMSWTVSADRAGEYAVEMTVNGLHGTEPLETEVDLSVNGETSRRSVRHDRDIEALIARYHRGMIAELGNVALKAGENHIALRLAEPAARDMFRFASMRLIRR